LLIQVSIEFHSSTNGHWMCNRKWRISVFFNLLSPGVPLVFWQFNSSLHVVVICITYSSNFTNDKSWVSCTCALYAKLMFTFWPLVLCHFSASHLWESSLSFLEMQCYQMLNENHRWKLCMLHCSTVWKWKEVSNNYYNYKINNIGQYWLFPLLCWSRCKLSSIPAQRDIGWAIERGESASCHAFFLDVKDLVSPVFITFSMQENLFEDIEYMR